MTTVPARVLSISPPFSVSSSVCKAAYALALAIALSEKDSNIRCSFRNMTSQKTIAKLESVDIAYFDVESDNPDGRTILLIHGFASTARVNWIDTSWSQTLADDGYRVIALDNRGHGDSSKFYSPADYGPDIFAKDALMLLDHLGIEQVDIMGYSMGARITSYICHEAPRRVRSAVLGGMGVHIFGGRSGYEDITAGLEADSLDTVTDPEARSFRTFADRVGADRLALAACIRPSRVKITPEIVGRIKTPVLIAVGTQDEIAGSPHELAATMPNAQAFDIEGLDHMKATGAPSYKTRVLDFLGV